MSKIVYFARYGSICNVSHIEKTFMGDRYFSKWLGGLDYRLSLQTVDVGYSNSIDLYINQKNIEDIIDLFKSGIAGEYKKDVEIFNNIDEPDRKYFKLFVRSHLILSILRKKLVKLKCNIRLLKDGDRIVIRSVCKYKILLFWNKCNDIQPYDIIMTRKELNECISSLQNLINYP